MDWVCSTSSMTFLAVWYSGEAVIESSVAVASCLVMHTDGEIIVKKEPMFIRQYDSLVQAEQEVE